MTNDITFDELKNGIRNSSLSVFRSHEADKQLVLTENDHSVQPLEEGSRTVSVEACDDWIALSANEYNDGEYGPNEVEWSAESVEEAVKLAERALLEE